MVRSKPRQLPGPRTSPSATLRDLSEMKAQNIIRWDSELRFAASNKAGNVEGWEDEV